MRPLFALLLCAAVPAFAQAPAPPAPPPSKAAACAECGVVTSVRSVTTQTAAPKSQTDSKPSGLMATVPLGGGGKAQVGSSTKLGFEATTQTTKWEVIVRMGDGRFRVLTLGEDPGVRKDDKVRVEEGRVVRRND